MDTKAIISGCIRRKASAQQKLYELFAPKMLAVCRRYARDLSEAEDMLQEGFIKVFEKIKHYQHKGSFEGWIRRIMVHTAIDHVRKQKQWMEPLEDKHEFKQNLDEKIIDDIDLEFLYEVIQGLPSGFRVIFNLYAIEGYSHKEIAEQLSISESTSRSQYTRARAQLQSKLYHYYQHAKAFKDVI